MLVPLVRGGGVPIKLSLFRYVKRAWKLPISASSFIGLKKKQKTNLFHFAVSHFVGKITRYIFSKFPPNFIYDMIQNEVAFHTFHGFLNAFQSEFIHSMAWPFINSHQGSLPGSTPPPRLEKRPLSPPARLSNVNKRHAAFWMRPNEEVVGWKGTTSMKWVGLH